ncbi:hypothetical protein ACWGKW_44115 [Streptomyces sp. NPDC054766]
MRRSVQLAVNTASLEKAHALAMELNYPGFHRNVPTDFRERLTRNGRADRLLDLARLKETGLVRERTTQCTDSTHVLTAVRNLTRLELVTEAALSHWKNWPALLGTC